MNVLGDRPLTVDEMMGRADIGSTKKTYVIDAIKKGIKKGTIDKFSHSKERNLYAGKHKYALLNGTDAHLALAAPYKKQNHLPNYMAMLPNDIRHLIIRFLQSPLQKQRILFPLIIRNLQLPLPIIIEAEQLLERESPVELIEEVISLSPLTKKCPPGKELNQKTNRCIKSCEPHQVRNEKGRCKPVKSPRCPPGKELNQKTGRCIKSCEPHQVRNEKGRCIKRK